MRKWMDKGAAKAEGGTPAPRRVLAGTKLYCLVTEAHRCAQLAQGCYAVLSRVGPELMTCWSLYPLRQERCATFGKINSH